MSNGLTGLQRRFVKHYSGDARAAAIAAGYSASVANKADSVLMKNDTILDALQLRETYMRSESVASRIERQEFWTSIMRDDEQDIKVRMTAARDLAKSEGDFIDRVDHTSSDGSMSNGNVTEMPDSKLIEIIDAEIVD